MAAGIPPFLLIADVREPWDAWRFAASVLLGLEARGARGTLLLTGAPAVPGALSGKHCFAQDHITDAVVGRAIEKILAGKTAGRVSLVHVFGAGLSKLGAAMAADLACRYFVSAFRYENAAHDLRTGNARCAGVFAEDEALAGTLRTICAPATPVHTAALTSAARPANSATGGQTVVAAAIGPYGDEYGMGRLMEAARRLREAGVELQVCLQGTGKGEERLRRLAGESGLSSTTTFVDPEMPYEHVVNAADIVVLAGDRRGATLPMIAAMLAGRLVLVCDTAGVEDLLGAGHGVLVAEPDAQSVADQIAAVAGDEHTRRSAGEAGPAAVLAARPLSKSIETIVAAYQGQVE